MYLQSWYQTMPGVWYQDTVVDRHFTHMLLDHQITNQITNQIQTYSVKLFLAQVTNLFFTLGLGRGWLLKKRSQALLLDQGQLSLVVELVVVLSGQLLLSQQ